MASLTVHGTAFLLLATAAAAGCEQASITTVDPTSTNLDLTGLWGGRAAESSFEVSLSHDTISEQVDGFGAIVRTGGSQAFRVDGLVDDERDVVTLLLELSSPTVTGETGITLVYYSARPFGPDRLQGTLNGGGFNEALLTLNRTGPLP